MEALYFIDRLITRGIQYLSRFLDRKLHLNLTFQFVALYSLILVTKGIFLDESNVDESRWGPMTYLPILIGLALICLKAIEWIGVILKKLHNFFDQEGSVNLEKEYEDGYYAWGFIILSALMVYLHSQHLGPNIDEIFGDLAGFNLMLAYDQFATRKKSSNSRKKKGVSEALTSLIDRCSSWLKSPKKVPST